MAQIVLMPKLGMTMEEGMISRWVKSEGERVEVGEIFVEVDNDKATVEVPSEHSGILRKILVPEGTTVPVSHAIAVIGTADEPVDRLPEVARATAQVYSQVTFQQGQAEAVGKEGRSDRINASPAAEQGAYLSRVRGSDPGGRITKEDVHKMATGVPAMPKILKTVPISGMRKLIGQVVTTSKQSIPHFYVTADMDMTSIMNWRETVQAENRVPPSITAIVAHALCQALKEYPIINSAIEDDLIRVYETTNLGVAVALDDGLVIANLVDAGRMNLDELNDQLTRTVDKFRSGKCTADECKGSTFTITNLGQYGVREFAAIIHPPESAILALGRCEQRMVVREGRPEIRWIMSVTISCDHRVIDGAIAAEFLDGLSRELASLRLG